MSGPDWCEGSEHAQRALRCRGSGRWVVEVWDEEDEEWKVTIWRGISLARAIQEAKRLHDEAQGQLGGGVFRIRDVDTDAELLAAIL